MDQQITINGRRVPGFGLGDGATTETPADGKALTGFMVGAGAMGFVSFLGGALFGRQGVSWPAVAVSTLGGGVAGAVLAPKVAQAAAKLPGEPVSLAVSDPPLIQAVNATPGTPVTLSLPAGAVWQNVSVGVPGNEMMGNLAKPGSSAPVTLTVPPAPGATIDANWTTADGKTHLQAIAALPAGATLATPVTDPSAVTAVQNVVNMISAQAAAGIPGLQPVPVNGTATDPAFVSQLAKVQSFITAQFAQMGRPYPFRTDGTLDYATYAIFSVPI